METAEKEFAQSPDEKVIFNLAIEEYKIVQSKIDKLGESKFRVKAWSITLLVASLAAATAAQLHSLYTIVLVIIPLVFFLLEKKIDKEQYEFGARSIDIEKYFRKLKLSDRKSKGQSFPEIAHHKHRFKINTKRQLNRKYGIKYSSKSSINAYGLIIYNSIKIRDWIFLRIDTLFYFVQVLSIFLALLLPPSNQEEDKSKPEVITINSLIENTQIEIEDGKIKKPEKDEK